MLLHVPGADRPKPCNLIPELEVQGAVPRSLDAARRKGAPMFA